jgi:hypothetical protein
MINLNAVGKCTALATNRTLVHLGITLYASQIQTKATAKLCSIELSFSYKFEARVGKRYQTQPWPVFYLSAHPEPIKTSA